MHHLLVAVVAKLIKKKKRKKKLQVKMLHHAQHAQVAPHRQIEMICVKPSFLEEGFFVSFRNEFASRALKSYRSTSL